MVEGDFDTVRTLLATPSADRSLPPRAVAPRNAAVPATQTPQAAAPHAVPPRAVAPRQVNVPMISADSAPPSLFPPLDAGNAGAAPVMDEIPPAPLFLFPDPWENAMGF